jgi:hypothetical protein
MRRALVVALALALAVPGSAAFAAGAGGSPGTASIAGSARAAAGRAAANTTVRLRNLATGQLAGTTTTNAAGEFSFVGLEAGNYVVELVNATGELIATGAPVAVADGMAVTGAGVSAAGAAAAATAGGVGSFFSSTLGLVAIAAAGAAVAGVTVAATRTPASPSR